MSIDIISAYLLDLLRDDFMFWLTDEHGIWITLKTINIFWKVGHTNENWKLKLFKSLGLSPEDLLDSDNITTLANALNEGAKALGLPTVEDLDQVISDLTETVESSVSTLESDYSLTDEELAAILEQLKSKPFNETTLSDLLAALAEAEESKA